MTGKTTTYVDVILPIAIRKPYTYVCPEELQQEVEFGVRVEVQFGRNKLYSAIVVKKHQTPPFGYDAKPILSVVDEGPLIDPIHFEFWKWLADYYGCSIGDVVSAAVPSGLKLSSETILVHADQAFLPPAGYSDDEYIVKEAIEIQGELKLDDVRKILNKKSIYPLIQSLIRKGVLVIQEELREKYKPKTEVFIQLNDEYNKEGGLKEALEKCKRSDKQQRALLAYVELERKQEWVNRKVLCKRAQIETPVINAIVKKEIFIAEEKEVSRLKSFGKDGDEGHILTGLQVESLEKIRKQFQEKQVVLLHGVTGSGKTRVYMELIQEVINNGGQVLYLLPEIALSAQLIQRLQAVFGDKVAAYHSRLSQSERVELWQSVYQGKEIILGARSSLFLPYRNLKLIVIDEEHDASFKQVDPAPRYNARDAAIYLATLQGAKTLMGTATPSVESYFNATTNKYGLVEMNERIGGLKMPLLEIVDLRVEQKKKKLKGSFSSVLLESLKNALEEGEQAIIFQNRRGFAPSIRCTVCNWTAQCIRCDVTLTYHKFFGNLRCHYCSYQTPMPHECLACGSPAIALQGFGTEKIEDELKVYFPEANIARMDYDVTRTKFAHAKIIHDFEERETDILVGTQMVTKGLDFDNVGIVGVLNADHQLNFPDFRSGERAFQLITQVSGRAGRKKKRGKVIVQTFNPAHPILQAVEKNDFQAFFTNELRQRKQFNYPPYCRLIKIKLKHKKPEIVNHASEQLTKGLKERLGKRVFGPAVPYVGRVRSYYLADILIKLEKNKKLINQTKDLIEKLVLEVQGTSGQSGTRINTDVDPL